MWEKVKSLLRRRSQETRLIFNVFGAARRDIGTPIAPKKNSLTEEEKAKGKEAQAVFNKDRADRLASSVDAAELRTQMWAMNVLKAQKILCEDELPIVKVWIEERKGSAIDILK